MKYVTIFSILFISVALILLASIKIALYMMPGATLGNRDWIGLLILIPLLAAVPTTIVWFCLDKAFNKSA